MQTVAAQLQTLFSQAIKDAFGVDADPLIGLSQNEKFGDYQSNAAMGLARQVSEKTGQKTNPRQVAEAIKAKLNLGDLASEISIAGPGFINVKLSPTWVAHQLNTTPDASEFIPKATHPQTVVIDYSGPNIAKELHVGHLRSTIIGDACSRVVELLGHRVIRQNHIGDWGTQFGMLIANLQDKEAGAADTYKLADLEAFYVEAKKRFDAEPAFQVRARENVVKLQSGDPAVRELWQFLVAKTRDHYLPIYRRLGVLLTPEHERGESFYNNRLADVVKELKAKGIATESEGATVVFVEGYENPLIIEKTGGGYLYGTTDLAAVKFRTQELGADRIVYFVDARQSQHFAQVFATAKKAGWAEGKSLEHAAFGTMLGPDGKPFKTKTGGTIKLKDLLDEGRDRAFALVTAKSPELPEDQRQAIAEKVGIGAIKYADLAKDRISDYSFSFDAMLSLEGNTAPYLQYAYARIQSIFRKAGGSTGGSAPITLDTPHELALAKHIMRFGEMIEQVAKDLKPHVLCTYLYDLATRFSGFYENCPVLTSEEPIRSSRLALCRLTADTMARGLDLLGIEHPDQM
jgi:arginyl-tRNA synthetase